MRRRLEIAFGKNVRRLRLARRLSQEELASLAGCHRNYIGFIERGERNISLAKIVAIADALRCTYNELFAGINRIDDISDCPKKDT